MRISVKLQKSVMLWGKCKIKARYAKLSNEDYAIVNNLHIEFHVNYGFVRNRNDHGYFIFYLFLFFNTLNSIAYLNCTFVRNKNHHWYSEGNRLDSKSHDNFSLLGYVSSPANTIRIIMFAQK